jgi:uncharacterized protein YndB with AHSA1/START domain
MTTTQNAPTKATLTRTGDREFRVERVFNAPREKVWRAYTDPTLLVQWWGRGNKCVLEKFEPVKGGHWRIVEHSEGEQHGFEGRFREVTPMERISQTFEWDGMPGHPSIDTAEFTDLGDGRTQLVSNSMFMTKDELDAMLGYGMEGGMNESYAALDRVLEKL